MKKLLKHSFMGLVAAGIAFGYVGIRGQIKHYDKIQDQRMQGSPPENQDGWGNEKTNVMTRAPQFFTIHSQANGI